MNTRITMKYKKQKDKKKRILFQKYELERKVYKAIANNTTLPNTLRANALFYLRSLPKNSSITRIRNRCVETGRGNAVYTQFRLSRLSFREAAQNGLLPGVFKSSW